VKAVRQGNETNQHLALKKINYKSPFTMASRFFSFLALNLLKGLFFVLSLATHAQETVNLVPNPSFEEFENGCPVNLNEMPIGWTKWRSTPNSFSTCVQPQTLVDSLGWAPYNGFGYQWPATGNSYIGMWGMGQGPDKPAQFREYLGCSLIEPLQVGETYFVSFKTSLAIGGAFPDPGFYYNPVWAISHMGLIFTTQAYQANGNPMPIPNFAHVYSETLITDTVNWVTIAGEVVADQAYTHMALGVFFETEYLDTLRLQFLPELPGSGAYFFADDVCVSKYPDCLAPPGLNENKATDDFIRLYPNPSSGTVAVSSKGLISEVEVFDLNGKLVFSASGFGSGSINLDISALPHGAYVALIKTNDKTYREKLVIVPE
jgi:hypothetical protein